jgi:hypothetical protein
VIVQISKVKSRVFVVTAVSTSDSNYKRIASIGILQKDVTTLLPSVRQHKTDILNVQEFLFVLTLLNGSLIIITDQRSRRDD